MTTSRPDLKFLFAHPAHLIAFGFGSGLVPKAPGTVGTLLGWPLAWLIVAAAPDLPNQLALLTASWIAKWLGVTGVNVITRVLGIILAALAAQYVLDGLLQSGVLPNRQTLS